MTVRSKGEWMVETLKRLQLDDLDVPMIARPRGPILGRSPFPRPSAVIAGDMKHDASGYNDEGICPSCADPPPPWPPIAQPAYPTPRTSAEDVDVWLGLIDRSVAAEREACAELCDEIVDLAEEEHDVHLGHIAKVLWERIRARGKQ